MSITRFPHPGTPLHLYRHLLREASYLPPVCEPYISKRIKSRYRECRNSQKPKLYIQKAHHDLRLLRAANAGDLQRMVRIFNDAFGRQGKRRRELVTSFFKKPAVSNSDDLEKTIASMLPSSPSSSSSSSSPKDPKTRVDGSNATVTSDPKRQDWLDDWDVGKLHAHARSQLTQAQDNFPKKMPSKMRAPPEKIIPQLNIWGKPFAPKPARTKLRKHWVSVLHQTLPPLPKGEWDTLRDLALGNAGPEWDSPPRRIQAELLSGEDSKEEWDWVKYATTPVCQVERSKSRNMRALSGQIEKDDLSNPQGAPNVHILRGRTLRRAVYRKLWESASIVEKTETKTGTKWNFTWGGTSKTIQKASSVHQECFEGVDGHGKLQKKESPTLAKT